MVSNINFKISGLIGNDYDCLTMHRKISCEWQNDGKIFNHHIMLDSILDGDIKDYLIVFLTEIYDKKI